jgi:hypothetical protein
VFVVTHLISIGHNNSTIFMKYAAWEHIDYFDVMHSPWLTHHRLHFGMHYYGNLPHTQRLTRISLKEDIIMLWKPLWDCCKRRFSYGTYVWSPASKVCLEMCVVICVEHIMWLC